MEPFLVIGRHIQHCHPLAFPVKRQTHDSKKQYKSAKPVDLQLNSLLMMKSITDGLCDLFFCDVDGCNTHAQIDLLCVFKSQ